MFLESNRVLRLVAAAVFLILIGSAIFSRLDVLFFNLFLLFYVIEHEARIQSVW